MCFVHIPRFFVFFNQGAVQKSSKKKQVYCIIAYLSKKQYYLTINLHAKDVSILSDPNWRKRKIS